MAQLARTVGRSRHGAPMAPAGGQLGLPADFLLDPRGRVVAVKYGQHAGDQWSVGQLLEHAATIRGSSPADPTCPPDVPYQANRSPERVRSRWPESHTMTPADIISYAHDSD